MVRPRRRRAALFFEHRKLFLDRVRDTLLTSATIVIDQKVTGNPREPGRKTSLRRAERPHRLKYPQEHFLRQILRLLRASRKAEAKSVDPPGVQPDEIFPRGFIAAQTPRNK